MSSQVELFTHVAYIVLIRFVVFVQIGSINVLSHQSSSLHELRVFRRKRCCIFFIGLEKLLEVLIEVSNFKRLTLTWDYFSWVLFSLLSMNQSQIFHFFKMFSKNFSFGGVNISEEFAWIAGPNLNHKGCTYPSWTTTLSGMTAPAATRPPVWTFACLTVAPIETKLPSSNCDPCKVVLGPTKTLFPILTFLERCARSWTIEFSPIFIPSVPIKVAPYHTDELKPKVTLPRMVALGAMKSASSIFGCAPP